MRTSEQEPIKQKNTTRVHKFLTERYDSTKQSLGLYKCSLWRQIIQSRQWQTTKILVLTQNNLTDKSIQAITNLFWPCLTLLWLNENMISNIGAAKIVKMAQDLKGNLGQLSELSLYDNHIGRQGYECVLGCQLYQLATLNLGLNVQNKVATWVHQKISINQGISRLKYLDLKNSKLGVNGIKFVTKIQLPQIVKLVLNQNNIGSQGARHVLKGEWPHLQQLQLGHNKISLIDFEYLTHNNWTKLRKLNLVYNVMSFVGFANTIMLEANIEQNKIMVWGLRNQQFEKKVVSVVLSAKPNIEKR